MESQKQAGLVLLAPAKLNLTLEVIGDRQDGFHEVRSILQTITLWDSLSVYLTPQGTTFRCSTARLETPDNLVLRAVESLRSGRSDRSVSIRLQKVIPESAGLGGGSSDAAATLRGLARLWDLNIGVPTLSGMAAKLGADVPFFLTGGTAFAEGRGERITPLPPPADHFTVVVMPAVPIPTPKTARLYASLNREHYSRGDHSSRLQEALTRQEKPDVSDLLFNVFESVAFKIYPGLSDIWQRFERAGAPGVHLAGSGPALFTLTRDGRLATSIYKKLKGDGLEVYLARTGN